jgi:hypothetical protein
MSRVATGVPNSLGFQIIGSQGSVSFDSARPDEFLLHQLSVAGPESNGPRLVTVGPEQPSFAYTMPRPTRGVGSGYGAAFIAKPRTSCPRSWTTARSAPTSGPGHQIMLVCDAAQQAAAQGRPFDIAKLDASAARPRPRPRPNRSPYDHIHPDKATASGPVCPGRRRSAQSGIGLAVAIALPVSPAASRPAAHQQAAR